MNDNPVYSTVTQTMFTLFASFLLLSCSPGSDEPSVPGTSKKKTGTETEKEKEKDASGVSSGGTKTESTPDVESNASNETNRLADATSPYLRMHADNPINWYPWGEKAFQKAKEEDKPIFLSIGYYTCHWCHVMERKVFMNEAIARKMNGTFVNVKVDREQRPAVDHTYMTAAHRMGRRGGWPLSVFMTPEKKPFWIATYIPPERMTSLIPKIRNLWTGKREKLLRSADRVSRTLNQTTGGSGEDVITQDQLTRTYEG